MTAIESAKPCKCLEPYVRAYAQRNVCLASETHVEPVPARLEQILEFEFRDPFDVCFSDGHKIESPTISLVGWQTHLRAELRMLGNVQSFGVFFQPAGVSHLFGIPIGELRNRSFDATSVLGRQMRSLWNELGEAGSFPRRVTVIERYLQKLVEQARSGDAAAACANRILSLRGLVNIDTLAREFHVSRRQLERTFATQIGVTPKSFSRIARFQTALDLKVINPNRTWLDTAHELGYFDQMHLIHDFKKLCGETPNSILARLGDARPEAVASAGANGKKD
jgi:AraC-like DNA-binding protein